MSDIPAYSEAGTDVLDAFYQDYVAAIFFFEDEHHEAVYERLLLRLMPKIRSFQVVCLGGKTKLIAKAKEDRPAGAKWLFVLDKDYDDLLGQVFVHNDVYYLRAFSIENYFVDLRGFISLAVEMDSRNLTVRKAVEQCAGYQAYYLRLVEILERIARIFVVARRYKVQIQTTKIPTDDLLAGAEADDLLPTNEWYEGFLERFLGALPKNAEWLAQNEMLQAELDRAFAKDSRVTFPPVPTADHLCGKHLLGCVLRMVQVWLGVSLAKLDVVELYARLAAHVDVGRLAYLSRNISHDHPELIAA